MLPALMVHPGMQGPSTNWGGCTQPAGQTQQSPRLASAAPCNLSTLADLIIQPARCPARWTVLTQETRRGARRHHAQTLTVVGCACVLEGCLREAFGTWRPVAPSMGATMMIPSRQPEPLSLLPLSSATRWGLVLCQLPPRIKELCPFTTGYCLSPVRHRVVCSKAPCPFNLAMAT